MMNPPAARGGGPGPTTAPEAESIMRQGGTEAMAGCHPPPPLPPPSPPPPPTPHAYSVPCRTATLSLSLLKLS